MVELQGESAQKEIENVKELIDFDFLIEKIDFKISMHSIKSVKSNFQINSCFEYIEKNKILNSFNNIRDSFVGLNVKKVVKDKKSDIELHFLIHECANQISFYRVPITLSKKNSNIEFSSRTIEKHILKDFKYESSRDLIKKSLLCFSELSKEILNDENRLKIVKAVRYSNNQINYFNLVFKDLSVGTVYYSISFIQNNDLIIPIYIVKFDNNLEKISLNCVPKFDPYIINTRTSNELINKGIRIQIPNAKVNIKTHLEPYFTFVKNSLKSKFKYLEIIENYAPQVLYSQIINEKHYYINSFVYFKIKSFEIEEIISEILIEIPDLTKPGSVLIEYSILRLSDYQDFSAKKLDYILWGNSIENSNTNVKILSIKRSPELKNSIFRFIYTLVFNNRQSPTNSKAIFAEKESGDFTMLSQISYDC